MRRLLVCLVVACAGAAPAHGATRTYSTGTVRQAIPDVGAVEQRLRVPDRGPVSYVSVGVRIDHPDDGQLTVQLVAPNGRAVTLSEKRGPGGNGFGAGAGCGGQLAYFENAEYDTPVAKGGPPFLEGPYRPEQSFARLDGVEADGTWRLRVTDDTAGETGAIRCVQLQISRNIVERETASRGRVSAELSFRESGFSYTGVHLRIRRAGRSGLDVSLGQVNCSGCPSSGPTLFASPGNTLTVRDLDADGEPEVLLDLYTGGAHCCFYTLVFRYRPAFHDYRRAFRLWGNPGYSLSDLDHDGRPELVTFDDRFAYAFAAYAFTSEPVVVLRYEHGTFVDLTLRFPGLIRGEAAERWRSYLQERDGPDPEVRSILAAYMADEYRLGRQDEGWQRLEAAYRRGDLGTGTTDGIWATGRAYLQKLRSSLRMLGYAT